MILWLDKKEKERIKALEKKYKIRLVDAGYYHGTPYYYFKSKKGNTIKKIFEAITHKHK